MCVPWPCPWAKNPPKGPASPRCRGEVALPWDTCGEADEMFCKQDGRVQEPLGAVPCLPWQPGAPRTHLATPDTGCRVGAASTWLPAAALRMEISNPKPTSLRPGRSFAGCRSASVPKDAPWGHRATSGCTWGAPGSFRGCCCRREGEKRKPGAQLSPTPALGSMWSQQRGLRRCQHWGLVAPALAAPLWSWGSSPRGVARASHRSPRCLVPVSPRSKVGRVPAGSLCLGGTRPAGGMLDAAWLETQLPRTRAPHP